MADPQRRKREFPAQYRERAQRVSGAEAETARQAREAAEESSYRAYKQETGKSGRGLGGAAAYQKWKAGRKKPKKSPGVTTEAAGDALAGS